MNSVYSVTGKHFYVCCVQKVRVQNADRQCVQGNCTVSSNLTKRSTCRYKERCYFDGERLEYRMMIGNVYREIVQSHQI